MKPKRDYDIEGVEIVPKGLAEKLYLDDPVPIFDNTEALKDQLKKADKQHPAYGLSEQDDDDE